MTAKRMLIVSAALSALLLSVNFGADLWFTPHPENMSVVSAGLTPVTYALGFVTAGLLLRSGHDRASRIISLIWVGTAAISAALAVFNATPTGRAVMINLARRLIS